MSNVALLALIALLVGCRTGLDTSKPFRTKNHVLAFARHVISRSDKCQAVLNKYPKMRNQYFFLPSTGTTHRVCFAATDLDAKLNEMKSIPPADAWIIVEIEPDASVKSIEVQNWDWKIR